VSLGVSVYGNGGMNTDYNRPNPLFVGAGTNTSGVDLEQLFIAPTVTFKLNDDHAIGLAVNFAYQTFAAKGLQNFANPFFSSNPTAVTDRGHDSSTGWGARIGWTGKLTDSVTLGATYQSKTHMGKFDKYSGLFANQGEFDIPANFGAGIAVKPAPTFTVAFDVERIQYSGIPSVGNPSLALLFAGVPLGANGGPGFGWQDITAYKLGASWDFSPTLTLRAGYNHSQNPIQPQDALINILAPGVIENHATVGLTWAVSKTGELSLNYMHAFSNSLTGPIPAAFGGGTVNLHMYQDSVGIAYGWKM
jgi:long-chain fatty acid transport protein